MYEVHTLSWGIGRAATLLKTLLQYYGKSLEVLPTPVQGQPQHLKYQNRIYIYKKTVQALQTNAALPRISGSRL